MRAVILADGDPPAEALLDEFLHGADLFVVTDGAANWLDPESRLPDFVLGDLDSLSDEARHRIGPDCIVELTGQDDTDIEKAVRFCLGRGASHIDVLGALGGRQDHTLAAYLLLVKYAQTHITLVGSVDSIRLVSGALRLRVQAGSTLSLLCLGSPATVSLSGVQWPLERTVMSPGTRGVSNRAVVKDVCVTAHEGYVLLCYPHHSSIETVQP